MASEIAEPFLLSSYPSPSKKSASSTPIYATYASDFSSSNGYAALAVQGDGIHLIDINTSAPVVSHTLGPSTTFSCPAVSTSRLHGADRVFSTYAAIASSADLLDGANGRTLWMWKDSLSGPLSERAAQKRKESSLPHPISELHVVKKGLLALSGTGHISCLGPDGVVIATHAGKAGTGVEVIKNFVFADTSLPGVSHSTTLIQVLAVDSAPRIRIYGIEEDGSLADVADLEAPIAHEQILRISLSKTGDLSILTKDATWHLYKIESLDGTKTQLSPCESPITLASLTFNANPSEVSTLSCDTTLVLLASISKTPREIVLLLWDLQYGVLVASQSLSIPTNLGTEPVRLELVQGSTSHALLVVSPTKRTSGAKASVYAVPITPGKSSIANAMKCADAGSRWVKQLDAESPYSEEQTKVLADMRKAIKANNAQAATEAFVAWTSGGGNSEDKPKIELGYAFVKEVLEVVLQPSATAANTTYPVGVITYLLESGTINSGMIPTGLLRSFRTRNDWKSIQQAFTTVRDLSEVEIIEHLAYVLAYSKKPTPAEDAMQVDSTSPHSDIPSLPVFLALCIRYPTSPAPLRAAIKTYLPDAGDVVLILHVLENWILQAKKKDVKLLPHPKTVKENNLGVMYVPVHPEDQETTKEIPSLKAIFQFTQTLLDTSFVSLVQNAAAHRVLRKINGHIEPVLSSLESTDQLRAPLLPFAKMHSKAIREAQFAREFPDAKKPVQDWRQRRRQAHEQAGMAIQLYQLEELVL